MCLDRYQPFLSKFNTGLWSFLGSIMRAPLRVTRHDSHEMDLQHHKAKFTADRYGAAVNFYLHPVTIWHCTRTL